jgi:hypothetical protein
VSETCAAPNPGDPTQTCDKIAHPFGAHMHQASGTVWPGVPVPARRTRKGSADLSRVKQVIDSIGERGKQVGPPRVASTAEELRDEAIRRVAANTSEEFRDQARQVLHQVALEMAELTAEDVMDRLTVETHDNRAMGAIMLWGTREGWIAKTDPEKFVQSRYPRRHKMDVRVWRSLVYLSTK